MIQNLRTAAPPQGNTPETPRSDAAHPSEISPDAVGAGIGGHYVYAHRDVHGNIFYIGKGSGDFAWSGQRSQAWQTYVETRSGGTFQAQIISYHLESQTAREEALLLIERYGSHLVNAEEARFDVTRRLKERLREAEKAHLALCETTRPLEHVVPREASDAYAQALQRAAQLETKVRREALLDDPSFNAEWNSYARSVLELLDRLTLCLVRLRDEDAIISAIEDVARRHPELSASNYKMAIIRRRLNVPPSATLRS